ncbi:MAG: chromate transporter [Phycisphaerales bacterium]|nr:chromate transporter [Phycisphaerales bacterium]
MPGPAENDEGGRARLMEVARLFLKLGFTAFGGPAAHVALMEEEVVNRRGWMDRQHFLDMVSAVNFIPGPNSTELAIHIGWIRAGWKGLIVAGVCFIVPAMLIVLPLAWCYVAYGATPAVGEALVGVKACMVAIVAVAMWRFAQTGIKDGFTAGVAVLALAGAVLCKRFGVPQQELIVLAVAAVAGMVWYGRGGGDAEGDRTRAASGTAKKMSRSLPLMVLPASVGAVGFSAQVLQMALFFLKVGATLFGSGYVLASFLHSGLVEQHRWLSEQELLDAIAVGQVTPGPLLTAATFIGYVVGVRKFGGGVGGGVVSGVVATVAIFLPSFLFICVLGPVLPWLRKSAWARGALDGMNAAVVSLIAVVTVWFAGSVLWRAGGVDPLAAAVFGVSLMLLLVTKINPTWLILSSGIVGVVAHAAR